MAEETKNFPHIELIRNVKININDVKKTFIFASREVKKNRKDVRPTCFIFNQIKVEAIEIRCLLCFMSQHLKLTLK